MNGVLQAGLRLPRSLSTRQTQNEWDESAVGLKEKEMEVRNSDPFDFVLDPLAGVRQVHVQTQFLGHESLRESSAGEGPEDEPDERDQRPGVVSKDSEGEDTGVHEVLPRTSSLEHLLQLCEYHAGAEPDQSRE